MDNRRENHDRHLIFDALLDLGTAYIMLFISDDCRLNIEGLIVIHDELIIK